MGMLRKTRKGSRQSTSLGGVGSVVLLTLLLLVGFELALQVRSHVRHGQSVFNLLTGETRYVFDRAVGIKTLRPSSNLTGSAITIKTNALGLRSPEIPLEREARSFRMAVIGASSVMGELATSNDETFSYILERRLESTFPGNRIDVINAGISGHRLRDQRRMIEKVVLAHEPDLIVMYSGFNDFADYCRRDDTETQPQGLPMLSLPDWVLSLDAIKRRTHFLRPVRSSAETRRPGTADLDRYRQDLLKIADLVKKNGVPMVLMTNAKAYSRALPEEEQQRLAANQLRFAPCFDLTGMLDLYAMHNQAIREIGEKHGFPVFDLEAVLAEGQAYFEDATHFNRLGEEMVGKYLHDFLIGQDLVRFRG